MPTSIRNNEVENVFLSFLRDGGKGSIGARTTLWSVEDWRSLFDLASRNGFLPFFYVSISAARPSNIPQEVFERWKNAFLSNLRHNAILERELFKVIDFLGERDVPVIPLKGPVLARLAYGDLALRQASCDLDVLVKPEDVGRAEELLGEMGYFYSDPAGADFFHKYRRQIMLYRRPGNHLSVLLDLHWDFRDRFTPTHVQRFWSNARYVDIVGKRVLQPAPEDLILFLALTAISDFDFIYLRYLNDIHVSVMKFHKEIEWGSVTSAARQHGISSAAFFALGLCQGLFGTAVPEESLAALRPSRMKERMLKPWINVPDLLGRRGGIAASYGWRLFASACLYSEGFFGCLRALLKKIFLPMREVMGFYGRPLHKRSYVLYAKRLLKPVLW